MKTATFVSLGLLSLSLASYAAAPDSRHVPLVARSISGVLDGMLAFSPLDPNNPKAVLAIGDCGGIITHLGSARLLTSHQTVGDGKITDGFFTIVAANGDTISGTYQGTVGWGTEPNQIIGHTVYKITGGTGRFAQATGVIESTSYVTFLGANVWEWPVTWVFEGTVSY